MRPPLPLLLLPPLPPDLRGAAPPDDRLGLLAASAKGEDPPLMDDTTSRARTEVAIGILIVCIDMLLVLEIIIKRQQEPCTVKFVGQQPTFTWSQSLRLAGSTGITDG